MVSDQEVRDEVRQWLTENWKNDAERSVDFVGPDPRSKWLSQVVEARWAVPRWPRQWYGRDYTDDQARIVEAEFAAVGAPGAGQDRTNLWANTMLKFGHGRFREEMVPKLLSGAFGMCLLYSEPAAGSDLAAVRTRAERDGDTFRVTGQKIWTSGAHAADYGMLLARTDWDQPKHKGLSFFFLPMKQPGVEVRPINQITGGAQFNEVFLDDVPVPAENLLGELNGGWSVLQTALAYERDLMGAAGRGTGKVTDDRVDALVKWAREAGCLLDPAIRQRVAQVTAWRMLNRLNNRRAKAELRQGNSSPVMSLGKLAMSRILHAEAKLKTDMLGVQALLDGPDHPQAAETNFLSLDAYFTSIGGGTDQIQRTIIGERILGLPKEPETDRNFPFREVKSGP